MESESLTLKLKLGLFLPDLYYVKQTTYICQDLSFPQNPKTPIV